MPKFINEIGNKYGSLIVVKRSPAKNNRIYWECACDCGNTVKFAGSWLRQGKVKSCGCKRYYYVQHGLSSHPLRDVFCQVVQRCYTPSHKRFSDYGGRGIKVCSLWLNSYATFAEWCLENGWEKGKSLDRVDNDKDYMPDNCRFVSLKENNQNKRTLQKSNKTGYSGVDRMSNGKWKVRISSDGLRVTLGTFDILQSAVEAKNNYIVNNNLPHRIQICVKDI